MGSFSFSTKVPGLTMDAMTAGSEVSSLQEKTSNILDSVKGILDKVEEVHAIISSIPSELKKC